MGRLEGAGHLSDVVTVDRTHVGEAQLFEHRTDLGNSQTAHAALEAVQFGGKITAHEGKMAHALFHAAGEELHRRTQPHAIQMTGESAHRR